LQACSCLAVFGPGDSMLYRLTSTPYACAQTAAAVAHAWLVLAHESIPVGQLTRPGPDLSVPAPPSPAPYACTDGSCGYYYLDEDKATGWDIAALADSNWGYNGECVSRVPSLLTGACMRLWGLWIGLWIGLCLPVGLPPACAPLTTAHVPPSGHAQGICFEVACSNTGFTDGYGTYMNRNDVCYDSAASVVVQITDTCECNYPSNQYSNKRW
jgi:hypothetical protein